MRNFKTQLSGQIGENLVVAELGRLGILATTLPGNAPDIDILAYANRKSIPIQVKSLRKGSLSVDARKYLHIEYVGKVQNVVGKVTDIDRGLVFVMVKIGVEIGDDEFYVYDQGVVQDLVHRNYLRFLKKHNGVRPRNYQTTHCAYSVNDLANYRNNWELITKQLVNTK